MWQRSTVALGFASLALLGCRELTELDLARCGNAIVEPFNREDCDTFAAGENTTCGAPDRGAQACRYICNAADASLECPEGYGCGSDGVCRRASGSYVGPLALRDALASELTAGDFDGDGRQELVIVDAEPPYGVEVRYFDSPSDSQAIVLPPTLGDPLALDLDQDGRSDLLLSDGTPAGGGLAALLGTSERALLPLASPTREIDGEAFPVTVESLPQRFGRELAWFSGDELYVQDLFDHWTRSQAAPAISDARRVAAGPLDEAVPCDALVTAPANSSTLRLLALCRPDGGGGWELNVDGMAAFVALADVALPDKVGSGLLLADLQPDGHLDVIVELSSGALAVTYGLGDGSFHSAAALPSGPADNTASLWTEGASLGGLPFAAADLNGDGALDFASATGLHLSDGSSWQAPQGAAPWRTAIVADPNGDGLPDLIAARADAARVDLFLSMGTAINPALLVTGAPVVELTTGDFDGDGVPDVAFHELLSEATEGLDTTMTALSVSYGRAFDQPHPPRRMSSFHHVTRLVAANFALSPDSQQQDGIDDLVAVGSREVEQGVTTEVALLVGNRERLLSAPLRPTFDGRRFWPYRKAADADIATVVGVDEAGQPMLYTAVLDEDDVHPRCTFEAEPPAGPDFWLAARIVHVDLGGGDYDELVAVGPGSEPGACSQLVVYHTTDDSYDPPQKMAEAFCSFRPGFGDCVPVVSGCLGAPAAEVAAFDSQLTAADIDGDGYQDLVAIMYDAEGGSIRGRAMAILNDGAGAFDIAGRIALEPAVALESVQAIAPIQADADRGVDLIACSASTCAFAGPGDLAIFFLGGAERLTGADLNGDGVDDIVMSGGDDSRLRVLLGEPRIP